MNNWNKKTVTGQQIAPLCNQYQIDQLLASIFVRRGITSGNDILYYLEDDLRFQHSPFLLNSIEDAVERIIQAKEEGEKVANKKTNINYKTLNAFINGTRIPKTDDLISISKELFIKIIIQYD